MTPFPHQHPRPDALPADFEAELHEADRLIEHWAAGQLRRADADLEHRVMAAVRAEIETTREPALAGSSSPRRAASQRAVHPHRLVPGGSAVLGRIGWSRLAAAACLGLACTVAVWVLRGPASTKPLPASGAVVVDVSWLSDDPEAEFDAPVAAYFDTMTMSLSDLAIFDDEM
ncbi:MAG: hypothetical protein GY715_11315 [Planctomycetes bacterium]|nr:hypothetical protein [Planctomycetota bacterium]